MEDKIYPNFVQGLVLTICLVAFLITSYALESIPLWLQIKVPDFYVSLAFAISSFLFVPITLYALKKSKINILENIFSPNIVTCGMLILLAVSFSILTLPLISPIIYGHLILNGQFGALGFGHLDFNTSFIIKLIHAVVLAPILEELFFRGILLQQFLKRYSPMKAILLSSLLFAFGHFRLLDIGSLLVYGIVFGYVFYKTKSIIASIIVHSASNLILHVFTKHYTIQMNDSSLIKTFFILSACLLVIYLFVKNVDRFQNLNEALKKE